MEKLWRLAFLLLLLKTCSSIPLQNRQDDTFVLPTSDFEVTVITTTDSVGSTFTGYLETLTDTANGAITTSTFIIGGGPADPSPTSSSFFPSSVSPADGVGAFTSPLVSPISTFLPLSSSSTDSDSSSYSSSVSPVDGTGSFTLPLLSPTSTFLPLSTSSTSIDGGIVPSGFPMTTDAAGQASATTEVTSTITSLPSFSTEVTSSDLWTTNTLLSTSVNGSPTTVPVLIGCPSCGGENNGIILFGVDPTIVNTVFSLPGLPSFSFPCIINCGNPQPVPPVTDPDNENTNSPEPTETSTTSTSASSSSSSPSTSSSSSSSSAATPTPYLIFPQESLSPAAQDSVTAQVVSMVEDPTSVFKSGDTTNGIAFWMAPLTPDQATTMEQNPSISIVMTDHPLFAEPEFDDTAPTKRSTGYDTFQANNTILNKRDGTIIAQGNSPLDLAILSQSREFETVEDSPVYLYDDRAGEGVTVYIIDTGANTASKQWTSLQGTTDWIYGGENIPTQDGNFQLDISESDKNGHGTCVLARAVSSLYGASKKSNVVIAKIPFLTFPATGSQPFASSAGVIDAFRQIRDDIITRGAQGKAVINFSYNVVTSDPRDTGAFRYWVKEFTTVLEVPFVTSSGNSRTTSEEVNAYPAMLAADPAIPIIVVGSTNSFGQRSAFSQGVDGGPYLTTSATGESENGEGVHCPSPSGQHEITTTWGTSYAAPMVTGYIAYLLSLQDPAIVSQIQVPGSIVQNIKKYIQDNHYVRGLGKGPGNVNVVYNGLDADQVIDTQTGDLTGCTDIPGVPEDRKRQDGGIASVCSLGTTSPSALPSSIISSAIPTTTEPAPTTTADLVPTTTAEPIPTTTEEPAPSSTSSSPPNLPTPGIAQPTCQPDSATALDLSITSQSITSFCTGQNVVSPDQYSTSTWYSDGVATSGLNISMSWQGGPDCPTILSVTDYTKECTDILTGLSNCGSEGQLGTTTDKHVGGTSAWNCGLWELQEEDRPSWITFDTATSGTITCSTPGLDPSDCNPTFAVPSGTAKNGMASSINLGHLMPRRTAVADPRKWWA